MRLPVEAGLNARSAKQHQQSVRSHKQAATESCESWPMASRNFFKITGKYGGHVNQQRRICVGGHIIAASLLLVQRSRPNRYWSPFKVLWVVERVVCRRQSNTG
jgi:hypothetical protein